MHDFDVIGGQIRELFSEFKTFDMKRYDRRPLPKSSRTVLFFFLVMGIAFSQMTVAVAEDGYAVKIETIEGADGVAELVREVEDTLTARAPEGALAGNALGFRIDQDAAYLAKRLQAAGYYAAEIVTDVEPDASTAVFTLDPGPQFTFGTVTIEHLPAQDADRLSEPLPPFDFLSAAPSQPALAGSVLEDEQKINNWLESNRCYFSYGVTHRATVDRANQVVNVVYRVSTGRPATFGDVQFEGQTSLKPEYLKQLVNLAPGTCFKRSKLNDIKVRLQGTGLFAGTTTRVSDRPNPDGRVDVVFDVREAKHRTVKAGAKFSTDIGPGISASWEHRNIFGEGEKLVASLLLATIEQKLETTLEKPFFRRRGQRLKLGAVVGREDNDAFETTGINVTAAVERDLKRNWKLGVGVGYGFERIKDQDGTEEDVAILDLPTYVSKDSRDNALSPTKGWTVRLSSTPAIDTINTGTAYIKNQFRGSYYQKLSPGGKVVLAGRIALGSLVGVETEDIPATERFYAGGGGSIRGYGYQLAGPVDADLDPLGGSSIFETSLEMRVRVTETIGLAAFVDGGNVYDSTTPEFGEDMLWGAGLGFRYYTSFGPIRLDIAVPLDKRDGVDDDFQIYFGIGQAF